MRDKFCQLLQKRPANQEVNSQLKIKKNIYSHHNGTVLVCCEWKPKIKNLHMASSEAQKRY